MFSTIVIFPLAQRVTAHFIRDEIPRGRPGICVDGAAPGSPRTRLVTAGPAAAGGDGGSLTHTSTQRRNRERPDLGLHTVNMWFSMLNVYASPFSVTGCRATHSDATTTTTITTTAASAWTVNTKELKRRFRKRVTHTRLRGKRASATLETPP